MGDGTVNRDIVVMGTHAFHAGVPLGDWHLARSLARRHRVLWVDPPASPVAPLRGVASRSMFRWRPTPVGETLVVGSPIVHSGRLRPGHAAFVDRLVAAQVRRWMGQLRMVDVALITFTSRYGALHGVPRRALTSWMKDRDWAYGDGRDADWLRARQHTLLRASDVAVGVSDAIVADCLAAGVAATRIPNGCDIEHYGTPHAEPPLLAALPRPRIVFSGAWNWRVDGALVRELVARLPAMSFIVLGEATAPVPKAPNVHALPAVPYSQLPAYLQAADVGIVPYSAGAFNDASCPLKIYEYLAAGLPVVASGVRTPDLPANLVRGAKGAEAFAAAVVDVASHDLRQACRAEASNHSWEARARQLMDLVDAAEGAGTLGRHRR